MDVLPEDAWQGMLGVVTELGIFLYRPLVPAVDMGQRYGQNKWD